MKLSTKSQYGLKACYILAKSYNLKMTSASVLEKEIDVSSKYLEKIMRMLSARGIVGAERGANGGYYLTKDPKDITAGEIVRALEDDMEIVECVVSPCKKCPTGAVWKKLYDAINGVLNDISLQSMIDDYERENTCVCGSSGVCNCNK